MTKSKIVAKCTKKIQINLVENNNTEQNEVLSQLSQQFFFHVDNVESDDALLATALGSTRFNQRSVLLRALIDQGSTTNLISVNACQLLKLKIIRSNIPMFGVGNSPVGNVVGRVSFEIGSIQAKEYKLTIRAIVVRNIGETKGFDKPSQNEWPHLKDLSFADPFYFKSGKIDLLLGSATHADILLEGVRKGGRYQSIAQQTRLDCIGSYENVE